MLLSPSCRTLFLLCLASGGWAFSFGLGAPLASLWLRDAGYNARVIGLNSSLYYLGVALTAFAVPYLMRQTSRGCVVGGILADGLVTAAFPWTDVLFVWFALRFIGGAGTALSIIPMETLVNQNALPHRRAQDFGWYAFSVALGVALGSLVGLYLYSIAPRLAFALGGLITLGAGLLVWLGWPGAYFPVEEHYDKSVVRLWANSLSFGTAWVQGFLEGGLIAFLSIYLFALDYSATTVSFFVGILFTGVILAQLPVAWLADRLGRFSVLLGCHSLLLISLVAVWFNPTSAVVAVSLFFLGTCCGALYPLGLALLGDRLPRAALARANAWYLASNCAGSLSGPIVFGLVIDQFGLPAQFTAGIMAVAFVLALWVISRHAQAKGETQMHAPMQSGSRKAG